MMKPKNDIKWRILDDAGCQELENHRNQFVIVETEIAIRIDSARYINVYSGYLTTAQEKVKRFAFFV